MSTKPDQFHGSDTTPDAFTVTTTGGVPTITGFSPEIASVGATLTVTGSNFEPAPVDDVVMVNVTSVQPLTATANQLQVQVPADVTTGRVQVSTPRGVASSSTYLWVPPPGYISAQVESTGIMPFDTPTTVSVAAAGQIGIRAFEGIAGESVSLEITGNTSGFGTYGVFSPFGQQVIGGAIENGFLTGAVLPVTGTYTFLMDPWNTSIGSATITLRTFTEPSIVAQTDGTPVTVTTTEPGQRARFVFTAAPGERFSALVSDVTIPGCQTWSVTLVAPDGTTLTSTRPCNTNYGYIDGFTLPAPGTYTVLFGGATTQVGSATIKIYKFNDVAGTITPGDPPVSVNTTLPGQEVRLTFSGTAGQMVSLLAQNVSVSEAIPTSCPWDLHLLSPSGSSVTGNHGCLGSTAMFLNTVTLPADGTYTVRFGGEVTGVGSATITLYDVVHISGVLNPGDPPATVTTTIPGQDARLTFSGTAGQRVSLRATDVSVTEVLPTSCQWDLYLLAPTGNTIGGNHACLGSTSLFVEPITLPETGTYTLRFGGELTGVGTATLIVYDVPPDPSQATTINGSIVHVELDVPGLDGSITFPCTGGQQTRIVVTNNSVDPVRLTWFDVNGSLYSVQSSASSFGVGPLVPADGPCSVSVDPFGPATGSLDIAVAAP